MTEETLFLDAVLGPEAATDIGSAIAATASLSARGLKIVPSAVVKQAIDATIASALHVDLIALLAEGWVLSGDIKAFGDPRAHPAGTTAVLTLGKHAIERDIKPVITIDLGGSHRFPVDLTIAVAGTFHGVEISIRDAAIVSVGSGTCDLAVSLMLAEKEVWTKTLADWRLPGVHVFEKAIAIPGI